MWVRMVVPGVRRGVLMCGGRAADADADTADRAHAADCTYTAHSTSSQVLAATTALQYIVAVIIRKV